MNLSCIPSLRFALALPTTLLMYLFLASCSTEGDESGDNKARHAARRSAGQKQSYSTNFLAREDPISEGGKWINGGSTGRNWGNVQTIPGLAFGTTVSGAPPYNDSAAVLAGTWGPNQIAQATVYSVNQTQAIAEEVELLLRTTITARRIKGYEFDYRVTSDGSQYLGIVRWNGRLNDFTNLTQKSCATGGPGLHNGDTVMATAIGSTLTMYINGTKYCEATDTAYTGGSPGMGFWNWGGTVEDNKNYGFTNFTASDGQ
jgi:hypothetical protein